MRPLVETGASAPAPASSPDAPGALFLEARPAWTPPSPTVQGLEGYLGACPASDRRGARRAGARRCRWRSPARPAPHAGGARTTPRPPAPRAPLPPSRRAHSPSPPTRAHAHTLARPPRRGRAREGEHVEAVVKAPSTLG